MKLAAAVILFHPEENFTNNILSYINSVEWLYIMDNSENKTQYSPDFQNITYSHDGFNMGIAKRLNQACQLAIQNGFDYLLTMDQDSYFEPYELQQYLQCISGFSNKTKVSMFGINHEALENRMPKCSQVESTELITSGSVVNLSIWEKICGFDENLFIDLVDHEYCYRSAINNYSTIQFPNIRLNHTLGKEFSGRSFKTLQKTKRTMHSPIRIYYMVRNYLYVNAKYKSYFPSELEKQKKSILVRIKNSIIYGTQKMTVLNLIFKAIKDYKQGRLGKINY